MSNGQFGMKPDTLDTLHCWVVRDVRAAYAVLLHHKSKSLELRVCLEIDSTHLSESGHLVNKALNTRGTCMLSSTLQESIVSLLDFVQH